MCIAGDISTRHKWCVLLLSLMCVFGKNRFVVCCCCTLWNAHSRCEICGYAGEGLIWRCGFPLAERSGVIDDAWATNRAGRWAFPEFIALLGVTIVFRIDCPRYSARVHFFVLLVMTHRTTFVYHSSTNRNGIRFFARGVLYFTLKRTQTPA